jgi:hypothetical protein
MRLLALCLVLCSCNRPDEITDGKPDTDPDDTTTEPECSGDIECDDWEICEVGVCIDGDRNNSADEAVAIGWDDPVLGYLNPEQDWDYYALTVEGGEFARISTRASGSEAGEPEASDEMDTVVATYDAEGNLLSWEDDYPTGGSVSGSDSIVYTYFAEAGTYFIAVMDYTTAFDTDEKAGGSDFSYVLTVQEYSGAPDEDDSFMDPGAERDVKEGYLYPVPVLLEAEGDSDWIQLNLPYGDCPVLLRGSAHLDGTDASPRVRLYTAEQDLLLDLDELGTNGAALYPSVDGGKAIVEALDDAGGGGDNHWFFVIASAYEQGYSTTTEGVELAYQIDDEPNDSLETSQLLDQEAVRTSGGSDYTAAHLWGTQDAEGDEDWYAFHAQAGWYINAWGTADYNGSLMDPAIELYDASGTLLTTWYDGSDRAPDLTNYAVEATGTHYLRVYDETGAAPGGAPYFYRFSVYVTDFEAS